MGQIKLYIAIVSIALFTIAILLFAINFGLDNNAAVRITDDPELTGLALSTETEMSNIKGDTQETYESILESSTDTGFTTTTGGTFSLTFSSLFSTTDNILRVGFKRIFGTGGNFAIFLTTLISIIAFLLAMYFVKTWLGRNPE